MSNYLERIGQDKIEDREEIEQLTARVRELEEENARLNRTNSSYANLTKAQESQLTNLRQRLYQLKGADSAIDSERQANCELTEQLAAEQLNNKLLRDAIGCLIRLCEMISAPDGPVFDLAKKAIATPISTEALDKYVAEKVKDATLHVADELQKTRLQMITDFGQYQESHEQITTLTQQRDLAVEALENCRLLAARHRKEEWAGHIMRFCKDAGLSGSPIRNDAIKESEAK